MTRVPSSPSADRPSDSLTAPQSPSARSKSETPAPDSVRAALRALATGAPPPRPEYRETVADADAAVASALDAAAFLRAGRLPELARAVGDAEAVARGEAPDGGAASRAEVTAERGRRALATLRRLDSAVECALDTGAEDAATVGEDPDAPRTADRDHFRSGRDIVLPRTDQLADR